MAETRAVRHVAGSGLVGMAGSFSLSTSSPEPSGLPMEHEATVIGGLWHQLSAFSVHACQTILLFVRHRQERSSLVRAYSDAFCYIQTAEAAMALTEGASTRLQHPLGK